MGRGKSKLSLIIPKIDYDEDDHLIEEVETPSLSEPKIQKVMELVNPKPSNEHKPIKKKTAFVEEITDGEYWKRDGLRYDVSLRCVNDHSRFVSQEEFDDINKAKAYAKHLFETEKLPVMLWDRHDPFSTIRFE